VANLIVATGHNNMAISRGVEQVAKRFVHGRKLEEERSTGLGAGARLRPLPELLHHALGMVPVKLSLVGPDGELLDERRRSRQARKRCLVQARARIRRRDLERAQCFGEIMRSW